MKFAVKTLEAKFLKRYKRFFADAELNGQIVVAHVPNTGSLKSVANAGAECLLTESTNPDRKLKFTLEAIQAPSKSWVGVNTSWPNHLVGEAFEKKIFKHWRKFEQSKNEVKISKESRIDWVFSSAGSDKKHYVEVKNVTMAEGDIHSNKGTAQFPDAVTERGQKHLRELMSLVDQGHTAEIFFAIQRSDCYEFAPADKIDSEYGKLLRQAKEHGVIITAAIVEINSQKIEITGQTLAIKL